ncbi:MAG: hypothetical protein P4N60_19680 [Verrucomicrobiae bacterium]|nr:hypothetical protein [Verrucomicrobiae bacterium]
MNIRNLTVLFLTTANLAMAASNSTDLELDGPAQGLVGNGRSVIVVTPAGFHYQRGEGGDGWLRIALAGQPVDLAKITWQTTAFPGGIIFTHRTPEGSLEIFDTALPDDPYGILVRLGGNFTNASVAIEGGRKFQSRFETNGANALFRLLGFSETGKIANADFDQLRVQVLVPYTERGMVLHSPDLLLDQAVLFNQYLLDLSDNGDLIVCELFRWADIWSRDAGSGFVPGSLFTGRIEAARKCIDVDLARHEKATARALKTTADASQGGSAEGVGHLTTALWDYYLVTGDRAYLARVAEGIRPWVDAWLARDYANTGLIVDTTDWMDHSRYLMLPFGSRTLYANTQMVRLLGTFTRVEQELGNKAGEARYARARDRFIAAINDHLWDENLGAYGNLLLGGQIDERTASAANSLALLGGVADAHRATRVLATLRAKNWRPNGTLTITPLMTYNPNSDQNEKIWPWWVAYEAMARFKNGDADGGLFLLHSCAATIRNPQYPGMMDETMSRDGQTEGGRAFATAAGSLLTSIYKGLFGIEILAGGMREVKVVPNLPSTWQTASLHQPTPGGSIDIEVRDQVAHITVNDPRVKIIYTTTNAIVTGAAKQVWHDPAPVAIKAEAPIAPPPLRARRAAYFDEPGFPHNSPIPTGTILPRLGCGELAALDAAKIGAVIIRGNALPFATAAGQPLQAALDRYLASGGMLIFQGVTMLSNQGNPPDQLGGNGGVIEWYGQSNSDWYPVNPRTGQRETRARRSGTIYWGEGNYFGGWDIERGAFGFQVDGQGIQLAKASPLPPTVENSTAQVAAAFTDFAVSKPWYFQPLATTHTAFNFLLPQKGENFPCAVRLVNRETHGEIILIAKGAESHINLANLINVGVEGEAATSTLGPR